MTLETYKRAVDELRGEGWQIRGASLYYAEIEELLGLEAAHQAEAAVQDTPENDADYKHGRLDGVTVYSHANPNSWFDVWGDQVVNESTGECRLVECRRYFHAVGECLNGWSWTR